jgi:membrane protease YdiL (CAAX protease family)
MTTSTLPNTSVGSSSPTSRRRIALFIAVVLSLGWLGPVIDRGADLADGESGPGQLIWILAPIGAALMLRWKGGDGFDDAGLRPAYRRNRLWYELSSAFYPTIMLVAVGAGVAANHYDVVDGAPARFAVLAAVGLLTVFPAALAEEFGWRGYLTPRLEAHGVSRLTNHLIVGAVWGTWHLPYLTAFWDYTDESLGTLAPRVVFGCMAASVLYGEIRIRTGSVWPAVLMHTTSNAVAYALLDGKVLTQLEPTPWLFSPGIAGMTIIVLTTIVAAVVHRLPHSGQ